MAVDPRKRQKKLAKKNAKRKEKHHTLVKERNAGLPEKLALAARFPVLEAVAADSIWEDGLGTVTLSREMPNGMVAFARFLIDTRCLGVKDVDINVINQSQYREMQHRASSRFPFRILTPADAVKIVEDAVAYARGLGLQPAADYARARTLFGGIDPNESRMEIEFGRDGKPFFMAGPYDTPAKCQRILRALEENCGPGNYHFMMPMSLHSMAGPASLTPEQIQEMALDFYPEDEDEEADDEPEVWEHPPLRREEP